MKVLKLIPAVLFLFGLGLFSQSFAQTTTWVFEAADNSGQMARVTTEGQADSVIKIEYANKGGAWINTTLIKVENDPTSYHCYAVVKSGSSGRTYELNIYFYDKKLTETNPEGVTLTYWIVN